LSQFFTVFIAFLAFFMVLQPSGFFDLWTQTPPMGLEWTQKWTHFLKKKPPNHNFKIINNLNF